MTNNKYTGYLFVHFTGEEENGEQVYFAVSRDGLHWKDLNEKQPVLKSRVGEKGVRDPFIIRAHDGSKYYIIATDLRIANEKGWGVAQYEGSQSVVIWESTDLIHWSEERICNIAIPEAGCVWAPEVIYNEEEKDYLVFWASMIKEEGEENAKQRIYVSNTKDFKEFSKPIKYIERENHVIDTTMIRQGSYYYRYSKDETTKVIRVDKNRNLSKGGFEDINSSTLKELYGVEGPAIFKFNDREEWCLIVDQYATNQGYLPLVTSDLNSGDFRILNKDEYDLDTNTKRHGSILNLTEEEYQRILEKWDKK